MKGLTQTIQHVGDGKDDYKDSYRAEKHKLEQKKPDLMFLKSSNRMKESGKYRCPPFTPSTPTNTSNIRQTSHTRNILKIHSPFSHKIYIKLCQTQYL